MMPDLQRRAEELFLELMELPADEQSRQLDARCADDPALRAEVASLLGHHDVSDRFLDAREVRRMAQAAEDAEVPEGTRIGDYTVGPSIGRGGMGVVYRAEQERPRRTVALKLVRRGLAGYAMLRRFEHEAEMLARLHHPGIAQIYGAGVADYGIGPTPYIAMELVKGPPITTWFKEHPADHRRKLEVMALVCDAVHHAHQRGIIHRDLKPANILVGEDDRPKVLDFGVARATDADLQATTLQTSIGQLIGTLAYMSPEQVLADPGEVDTRSDVYALGVLLFEVLVGRLPLDLAGLSLAEAARKVRDEVPVRLASVDPGLRGEVDTIIAKALEKDKARRYQSAQALADDLRAHLAGEPIAAKADSTLYVLRAQFRRHRVPALAGLATLLAGIAFLIYATNQAAVKGRLAVSEAAAKQDALEALAEAEKLRIEASTAAEEARSALRVSRIEQARLLGASGNVRAAETLLWPEFLRSPGDPLSHWALWELMSRQPSLRTFDAGSSRLICTTFSHDGTAAYIGDDLGILRRFDLDQSTPSHTWDLAAGIVRDIRFSPVAPLYAVATDGGLLILRDSADQELHRITAHQGRANRIAWSPDGSLIATVGDDGAVRIFNASDLSLKAEAFAEGKPRQHSLRFHPSGTRIACAGSDSWIHTFDLANDVLTGGRFAAIEGDINNILYTPDGGTLFAGGSDRLLWFFNDQTRELIAKKPTENGVPNSIELSPDGSTFLLAGWFRIDLWDVPSLERRTDGPQRSEGATDAMFSPDGSLILGITAAGRNRLWELTPDAHRVTLARYGNHGWGLSVSADGSRLASSGDGGVVRVWRTDDWSLINKFEINALIAQTMLDPSGTILATTDSGGVIRIWDVATGAEITRLESSPRRTNEVRFSPDGRWFAAVGRDYSVRLWNTTDWTPVGRYNGPAEPLALAFHPTLPILVSADRAEGIRFLHVPDLTLEREADINDVTWWGMTFSPDGSTLFVGTWGQTIKAIDFATGNVLAAMSGHTDVVMSVACTNDGRKLASIGTNGMVLLWDTSTFGRLAELSPPLSEGHRVCAIPGSNRLALVRHSGVEIIDLDYFDRHIVGHIAAYSASQVAASGPESIDAAALARFTEDVQSRTRPPMPTKSLADEVVPTPGSP